MVAQMGRNIRGCLTAWLQPGGAVVPENSSSVLLLEEKEDAKDGKATVDYKPDIDYKPEGPDLMMS